MRIAKCLALMFTAPVLLIVVGSLWGRLLAWDLTGPQATLMAGGLAVFGALLALAGVRHQVREQERSTRSQHYREIAIEQIGEIRTTLANFLREETTLSRQRPTAVDQLIWEGLANKLDFQALTLQLIGMGEGYEAVTSFARLLRAERTHAADLATREKVAASAQAAVRTLQADFRRI